MVEARQGGSELDFAEFNKGMNRTRNIAALSSSVDCSPVIPGVGLLRYMLRRGRYCEE